MTISKALLDELLKGVEQPEDLLGDKGLMKELKVRLMERMLGAELTAHLGYEPHGEPADQQANRRNGATRKVLKGNDGAVPIDIPRDREGSFEPELIRKGQTRIDGIDDKIIGLYAAGLSTRDIRDQTNLSGHTQFREKGTLRQRMGCGTKPVRYPIPRTVQQMTRFNRMGQNPYTESRILP